MEIIGNKIQPSVKIVRQVVTADNNTTFLSFEKILEQNHTQHNTEKLNQIEDLSQRRSAQTAGVINSPHSGLESTHENTQATNTFTTVKDQEISFLSSKIMKQKPVRSFYNTSNLQD
jgi:hypothetical protein